eukprot:TRINITY_DN74_c0_g2_i3.p1 TRINITY_DN74_c0_g2~~TRINITY_DN74_c0_g2_i3.p1  ORF type:complete len:216 (-),score=53.19 TRINITY_DN74_c0_g2_i3:63-710(-)
MVDELQVGCPNAGCGQVLQRQQLQTHLQQSCAFTQLRCTYARYGCEFSGPRSKLGEHNSTPDADQKCVEDLTTQVALLQREVAELKAAAATASTAPSPASAAVPAPALLTIEVGNTHEEVRTNYHKWTLRITGPGGASLAGVVTCARVKLHKSFPQSLHNLTSHPLQLTGTAWGTFNIKIRLLTTSGHVYNVGYPLQFDHPWNAITYNNLTPASA